MGETSVNNFIHNILSKRDKAKSHLLKISEKSWHANICLSVVAERRSPSTTIITNPRSPLPPQRPHSGKVGCLSILWNRISGRVREKPSEGDYYGAMSPGRCFPCWHAETMSSMHPGYGCISLSISEAVRCLLWLHTGFSAFNVTLYSRMCFVEWVEG